MIGSSWGASSRVAPRPVPLPPPAREPGPNRKELMMFRRSRQQIVASKPVAAFDDLHDWVLSLPWVVERPYNLDTPGVRCFGVDCEPLGRRQLWLMTGLYGRSTGSSPSLTVIVPQVAAHEIEDAGWGRT